MSQSVVAEGKIGLPLAADSLRLLADYVLLRHIAREKSSGGIFLPKNKATECWIGEAISVGKAIPNPRTGRDFPLEIEIGALYLTMEYMGVEFEENGESYRILHEHGLWAKVTMKDASSYEFATIEPRFNGILVEPVEEKMTKGGIFIANDQKREEGCRMAKVIARGPGQWQAATGLRFPLPVELGQTILMTRYAGAEVLVNGKWMRLLQCQLEGTIEQRDIKCIVEN